MAESNSQTSDSSGESSPTVDQPNTLADPGLVPIEGPGTKIDRYKLLEQIGEGGFGVVFMAEQEFPVRRRVALKIIKLGMDTKAVVARFEAERQALAMMDHPNIAKVLDGGSTGAGRPYFVMELVRGIPITDYCDKNKLSIRKRLDLFEQVCQAVQHAHQKGVIHRDLKPSNILVSTQDDRPLVKVIDFGVAKATQSRLTEKTLFTHFHQMIGTPLYMSPEQADGDLDIDTRSDVYSLGVMLYELLSGSTPFDARELSVNAYAKMQQIIREVEPPTPSTKLSTLREKLPTIAARRDIDPAKLKTILRGELDWIVMRSLEKDRKRRYQSASELSEDIRRYLTNEPIKARPVTATYRLRKFVRRNNRYVIAGCAIVLAMMLGLAVATVEFLRARVERDRAEAATVLANENFREARAAVEDLLQISDEKLKDLPGMQPVRLELMKAAIDGYEPFLAKPSADPTPRAELARLYVRYGQAYYESQPASDARDQVVLAAYEKARGIQEQLLQEHPGDRSLRSDLGWTLIWESWWTHNLPPSAREAGVKAMALFRQLVADDPADPFARDDLLWAIQQYTSLRGMFTDADVQPLVEEGIAIGEELVRQYPLSVEFRRDLGNTLELEQERLLEANPTPQQAQKSLPVSLRIVEIRQAVLADFNANRPDVFLPQRPSTSQGRMVYPARIWLEYDVAREGFLGEEIYGTLKDWPNLMSTLQQSSAMFKDLVEHNPSVDNFTSDLALIFDDRIHAAVQAHDMTTATAWSRDAVEFWKRQVELHPDIPALSHYLDEAVKSDGELSQRLAQGSSTKP